MQREMTITILRLHRASGSLVSSIFVSSLLALLFTFARVSVHFASNVSTMHYLVSMHLLLSPLIPNNNPFVAYFRQIVEKTARFRNKIIEG